MEINPNKNNIFAKANYTKPEIQKVELDNDISLQLASDQPPAFDNENISYLLSYPTNSPFKQS